MIFSKSLSTMVIVMNIITLIITIERNSKQKKKIPPWKVISLKKLSSGVMWWIGWHCKIDLAKIDSQNNNNDLKSQRRSFEYSRVLQLLHFYPFFVFVCSLQVTSPQSLWVDVLPLLLAACLLLS